MPLFRAVYIRSGLPRGMTFAATCPPMAADFAYTTLQDYIHSIGGGDILTVDHADRKKTPRRSSP